MPKKTVKQSIIGNPFGNFWLYHTDYGYDLTHPPHPHAPPVPDRITLDTRGSRVAVDPNKSALVIVDMQNFFLNPQLGRPTTSNGLNACNQLIKHAIPACREAGIQIIWLNWGLSKEDLTMMPPAVMRAFGFDTRKPSPLFPPFPSFENREDEPRPDQESLEGPAKKKRKFLGPGAEVGLVELEGNMMATGGGLLMRGSWNAALFPPMEEARKEGLRKEVKKKDVIIHKNRMSGLWGMETPCSMFLASQGIRTLFFAGVNTDQCVGGSLQDAFSKGYDCFLLSDGCGTSSPDFAQQCMEYNSIKSWGFVLSCEQLATGIRVSRGLPEKEASDDGVSEDEADDSDSDISEDEGFQNTDNS